MFDHQVFVNKFNEILDLLSEQLSENEKEFLTSYMQSGEWYLALETLCEILIENDVTLNPKSYKIVEELGLALNLEPPIWQMLKPQLMIA